MKSIIKQIEKYIPYDEQEERDRKQFLQIMNTYDDVLTRKNTIAHFSSSALVLNKEKTKMVFVYHNIYNGWVYPGGHADGEENLLSVAVREVEEETGLKVKVLDDEIFSIQTIAVKGHIKHNKYVSAHLHLDVIFAMEADDSIPLVYREEESKGAKWIPIENILDENICDFVRPIHNKLLDKLKLLDN